MGSKYQFQKTHLFEDMHVFFQEITIIFEDFCANYIFTSLQGTNISISIEFA